MNIVIDGSTLSLLLYTHMNGKGNQMGFLVGYKTEDIQDRISDSQIHTEDTKRYIYVSSYIPWPGLKSLHGDYEEVKDFNKAFEEENEKIIGWYSFRRQSSLRPSLKEASMHHRLTESEEFKENEDFLFFLCSSSASSNLSTHASNHAFMCYDSCKRKFKAVSMSIRNLGDTPKSEYQKPSTAFTIPSHKAQEAVAKSVKDFVGRTGQMDQVVKMKQLADSIGNNMSSLQVQVSKSEADVSLLEYEIRFLREKMAHLETKDMSQTFKREQQRIEEEEEDQLQKESVKEIEEEEQIDKLLTDLGLPKDLASTMFQKPKEVTRKLSEDQDDLITWENMEVNPLYASTLNNSQSVSYQSDCDILPSESKKAPHAVDGAPSSVPSSSSPSNSHDADDDDVTQKNSWLSKDKKNSNTKCGNETRRDPFDFVEQFKSELNTQKASSSVTGISENGSSQMVSIKSSAIRPSVNKDSKNRENLRPDNDNFNSQRQLYKEDGVKLKGSEIAEKEQTVSQETSTKLSSSPVF